MLERLRRLPGPSPSFPVQSPRPRPAFLRIPWETPAGPDLDDMAGALPDELVMRRRNMRASVRARLKLSLAGRSRRLRAACLVTAFLDCRSVAVRPLGSLPTIMCSLRT